MAASSAPRTSSTPARIAHDPLGDPSQLLPVCEVVVGGTQEQQEEDLRTYQERLSLSIEALNPLQREAVLAKNGPLMLIAGPGSGKTRVITHRVAHMVLQRNMDPSSICMVTFSNKAAAEMKNRTHALIGSQSRHLLIGTFHKICGVLLRRSGECVGVDRKFVLLDQSDSADLMLQQIATLNSTSNLDRKLTESTASAKKILNAYSCFRNTGLWGQKAEARIFEEVCDLYETAKERANMLDFDDMIVKAHRLGKDFPAALRQVASRLRCVIVDEWQDVNKMQMELSLQWASVHQNITVVGDPNQRIYTWRYAHLTAEEDFLKHFSKATKMELPQNYRSSSSVVGASWRLVSCPHQFQETKHDVRKLPLFTKHPPAAPVVSLGFPDPASQAMALVQEMKYLVAWSGGALQYQDIAVLVRFKRSMRPFEEPLVQEGVPYRLIGDVRLSDRKETRDLMAYLRVALNPNDRLSLSRAISTPSRKVGKQSLKKLSILATEHNMSDFEMLASGPRKLLPTSLCRPSVLEFVDIIHSLRDHIVRNTPLEEVMEFLLQSTQYIESIRKETGADEDERRSRLGVIEALRNVARRADKEFEVQLDALQRQLDKEDEEPWSSLSPTESSVTSRKTGGPGMPIEDLEVGENTPKEAWKQGRMDSSEEGRRSGTSASVSSATGWSPAAQGRDKEEDSQDVSSSSVDSEFEEEEAEGETDLLPALNRISFFSEMMALDSEMSTSRNKDSAAGVTFMTVHTCKGMEWPVVFLVDMDGYPRPGTTVAELLEERRLIFVGMTRAEVFLYVTWVENRFGKSKLSPWVHTLEWDFQKHHSMGGKTSSGVEDGHQQEEGDIPHNTPPESHTLVGEVIPHKVLRYSALHRDACGHLLCKQLLSETTGLWWHEVRQILRARGRTLPELPPGPPPKPRPSEVFRCGMPVASTHAFSRLQWKAAGQHSKPLHSSAPGHGGVSAAPPSTFVPASAVLREQVRPSPFHGMGFSSASSLLLCDRKLLPPTAERKTSAPSPSDVTGQSEKGRKNRIPSRQDAADSKAGELGMVRVHEGPRKIRSKASKRMPLSQEVEVDLQTGAKRACPGSSRIKMERKVDGFRSRGRGRK